MSFQATNPQYRNGCTLIQGDSLLVLPYLPAGIVDAVVTDPPYGIGYKDGSGRSVVNDNAPFIWWLYHACRATKPGGSLLCFCRWDVQDAFKFAIEIAGYKVRSQVIWDRVVHGAGDTKRTFAPRHDVIWFATKGDFFFPAGRPASVLPVRRILNNLVHPTEKPVDLMQDLICSVCPQDGLVVDPFMGSGPTGLAALNSSRRFLGIEITDEHYATAKRRLELHSVECVSWPSVKVDLGRSEAF